jgi:glucokinase
VETLSVLALDVGGTHVRSAWVEGRVIHNDQRVLTDLSGVARSLGEKAEEGVLNLLLEHIRARLQDGPAEALALGVAGFIDSKGVVIASPNIPGVSEFPLRERLEVALGVPVMVANDGLCAAQGQWLLERRQPRSLAILTLGTGVGGGLILDGRPVVGDGGTAMEIGHISVVRDGSPCGCGKAGCLEQYASASALVRRDAALSSTGRDAKTLSQAARNGENTARELFHQAGSYVGVAVAHLVLMVDVRTVRIGGGLSRSWDLMERAFTESLAEYLIPPLRNVVDVAPVPQSKIDHIGMLGAAHLARLPSKEGER